MVILINVVTRCTKNVWEMFHSNPAKCRTIAHPYSITQSELLALTCKFLRILFSYVTMGMT